MAKKKDAGEDAMKEQNMADPGISAARAFALEVAQGKKRGAAWRKAFLLVLARTGNVSLACAAAGTDRQNAYQLRDRDEAFAAAWKHALEEASDLLEEEAWRRAVEGIERYVVSHGKIVLGPDGKPLVERHYSDMLLERLLRAHNPEKFRESYHVSTQVGATVKIYGGFDPDKL